MPRKSRKKSESGIYHVMLRGINQQQILEDDEDNEKFLDVLEDCKKASGFELYAYCLMGNHVHLLLKVINEDLDQIFKRIGARYVYWYNWKYHRLGHLFQDRFKSEPVEDDRYFLTVLRYIHQNPIKAKICNSVENYRWSSYNEYTGNSKITDCDFALSMTGIDEFIKFQNSNNDDFCLEHEVVFRLRDDEVKEIIKKICNAATVEGFLRFNSSERDFYLKELRKSGASIRQISRLTGVSKAIVEKTSDR